MKKTKIEKAKVVRNDLSLKDNFKTENRYNYDRELLISNQILNQFKNENKILKFNLEKYSIDLKKIKVYDTNIVTIR
jgi:hypothetical protein